MSGLYLYALVTDPEGIGAIRGARGERLRAVACSGLSAVVGAIEEPPAVDADALRAHDGTVRRLADHARAILPARFGSLVEDETALERLLTPRATDLRAALALVEGREQMSLRVYGPSSTPAPTPATDPSSDLGPGARYLAERRRARSVPEIEPLRLRLAHVVHAERIERHLTPPLLASVYHLIDRGRAPEYAAAVDETATALAPMRVDVSGPWPPYAFAPEGVA